MLVLDGHKSAVYALAFSPDGGRLASGDKAGKVLLWDGGEPTTLRSQDDAKQGGDSVNGLAFTPDGVRLFAALQSGWVDLAVDRTPESAPWFLPWMSWPVAGLAVVGASHLLVGSGDRTKASGGMLTLRHLTADVRSPEFAAPKGVRSVAAAGERVAWSEWGRLLYVWDIRKPDRVKLPLAAEAPCVALAPDGTQLAAGADYAVKLFDVAGKRERLSLAGHKGKVTAVAFTPDGGTVVSGSWDGTVRLWDAAAGTERAAYRWPVGKVTSLAVAPDGLRLAVGGDGGAVVLADLD